MSALGDNEGVPPASAAVAELTCDLLTVLKIATQGIHAATAAEATVRATALVLVRCAKAGHERELFGLAADMFRRWQLMPPVADDAKSHERSGRLN